MDPSIFRLPLYVRRLPWWLDPKHPPPPNADKVASIVNASILKIPVAKIADEQKREAVMAGLTAHIRDEIDELCPRIPRPPFPPGPHSLALSVASELSLIAANLAEGPLQTDLRSVASEITERSAF
jgi:hypothetical protein